jgi:hypothetical protein
MTLIGTICRAVVYEVNDAIVARSLRQVGKIQGLSMQLFVEARFYLRPEEQLREVVR